MMVRKVVVVNFVVKPIHSCDMLYSQKMALSYRCRKKSFSKTTNICLHFESTEFVWVDKYVVFNKSSAIFSQKLL